MGKGDKKSKKGKRFMHSYGKSRMRKKNFMKLSDNKTEAKIKAAEQKKTVKQEPEVEKLPLVEAGIEEVEIKTPETVEIKEEIKPAETQEKDISKVPEIAPELVKADPEQKEPVEEETKKEEAQTELAKHESPTEEIKKEELKEKQEAKEEEIQTELQKQVTPTEEIKKDEPKEKEEAKVEKPVKEKSGEKETKKEKKPKKKKETKDKTTKAAPKKRGRPRKKKEE